MEGTSSRPQARARNCNGYLGKVLFERAAISLMENHGFPPYATSFNGTPGTKNKEDDLGE